MWFGLALLCCACGDDARDASGASSGSASGNGGAGATGGEGTAGAGVGGGGATAACEAVAPHQISETPGAAGATRVVWNGDGYGVIWSDDRDAPDNTGDETEMYFARLDPKGNKIGTDVRVTNAPGTTGVGSLVWNGSEYGVVFGDARTSAGIYFTRLDASGTKLSDEVLLTPGQVPRLTWSGSEYGFSFTDSGAVQFVRLDPEGAMLHAPTVVGEGWNPSQARSTDGWGIAFHDPIDPLQVYFTRLDDRGALAAPPTLVSTGPGWHASLAARGDGFGVAWNSGFEMGMAVAGQIWFAELNHDGVVVGEQKPVSGPPGGVLFPSLAANPSGWGLAWVDDTKLSMSLVDAGGGVEPPSLLSSTAVESFLYMQMTANGSGYGLVWTDSSDGTDEVWFATSCGE